MAATFITALEVLAIFLSDIIYNGRNGSLPSGYDVSWLDVAVYESIQRYFQQFSDDSVPRRDSLWHSSSRIYYSRDCLLNLRKSKSRPNKDVLATLKDMSIFKFRGKRSGRKKEISCKIPVRISNGNKDLEFNYYSRFQSKSGSVNTDNLIFVPIQETQYTIPVRITDRNYVHCLNDSAFSELHATPFVNVMNLTVPTLACPSTNDLRNSFDLCLLNTRSVRNKTLIVNDFVTDHNIDIMALTETWLGSTGDDVRIGELCPDGYGFVNVPRQNEKRGGGVGLLYKDSLRIKSKRCDSFTSFEYLDIVLINLINLRIFIIYRPPPSQVNGLSAILFFNEFSDFLEKVVVLPEGILILGDFNFHVNDDNDPLAKRFIELLESFNLSQHVLFPTHHSGHTLDLFITRSDDSLVSNVHVSDQSISDHLPVFCNLNLVKPVARKKNISVRKLKSVCSESFKNDIINSNLFEDDIDLLSLVSSYNDTLSSILDSHAPLRHRTITIRAKAPWYTPEIDLQKKLRRRLERCWRSTGLSTDKARYSRQCVVVNNMLYSSKQEYYNKMVTDNENDQRSLFNIVTKLFRSRSELVYPTSPDDASLANSFIEFFLNKIQAIQKDISNKCSGSSSSESVSVTCALQAFQPLSAADVSRLVGFTAKSCSLDPIPASVLIDCRDVLIPLFTKIVNLSLLHGDLPDSLKIAKLTPLLKKPNADHEKFCNFRPVSNLPFLSKLIEKAVACQLHKYLIDNNLHDRFQSAYKTLHSTETALVRIHNDILQSIDNDRCVILLFLDMSAAFDTVMHDTLLDRLANRFGIGGIVLSWFRSYLSNRKQFVGINDSKSSLFNLDVGVPQSSVLGPILFLLYTSPLADIVKRHNLSYHFYADDSQLYLAFKRNDHNDLVESKLCIEECINDIFQWMLVNGLKLNHEKTKFVCIHSKFYPSPPLNHIEICGEIIVPSVSAANLGVVFDEHMTGELQVKKICKSSYFHLRNISVIRKYLTTDATKTIVHAFISSRLDYCNSLLYGIPKHRLAMLQRVQNTAARVVTQTRKFDHITPVLVDLHWLPVYYRVVFKVLLLAYKSLNDLVPTYLSDLVSYRSSNYALRSVSNQLLVQPKARLSNYGFRSFSVAAPKLWNKLPFDIRASQSVSLFKKRLKTYLFSLFISDKSYS